MVIGRFRDRREWWALSALSVLPVVAVVLLGLDLLWWVGATLLSLAIALVGARRLVAGRLRRLARVVSAVAGESWERVGEPYGPAELGEAEQAVDALAEVVGRRRVEREAVHREALEHATRFTQLTESIDDVFWISEPGPQPIKYLSPAFERIWGLPPAAVYENHRLWFESIHPSDRDRVVADVARHEEAGTYDIVYRIVRPDTEARWIRDKAFPVRNEHGEIVRIFGIAEDVTAAKELEQQFLQAQKMESMGRLAAGVAHDFNNLLMVIRGYAEMARGTAEGEAREALGEVVEAATQAADITGQLLAFSRKQVLDPVDLDLHELVLSSEKMMRHLAGSQVEVVIVPGADVGRVHCDRNQLRQVLMNLVVNARDAMESGGRVTIEFYDVDVDESYAETHLQKRPGPYVVLSVTDTGAGMDEETRRRIFDPFFTTKSAGKGTGLGLATVSGIVEQTGGEIFVYSEVGVGTSFKIYFPRYDGPRETPRRKEAAERAVPEGLVVLLADDDPAIRALLFSVFRNRGHTVLAARGVEGALSELEDFDGKIDLLLTDVAMRGMDGFALAERVRRVQPTCPVVFMSGFADVSVEGLPPCSAFVAKPFGATELFGAVARALAGASPDVADAER